MYYYLPSCKYVENKYEDTQCVQRSYTVIVARDIWVWGEDVSWFFKTGAFVIKIQNIMITKY